MLQLILHLVGDYLLQSEQMSEKKRSSSVWAGFHAITYSLLFLLLSPSWIAWSVICGSHFLIDRFGLARYVVWAKNIALGLWPKWLCCRIANTGSTGEEWELDRQRFSWTNCKLTGYPSEVPPWLAGMLIIVSDNTIHLFINWASLQYL
jgi:Protein of unknown function (DUF3307)